MNAMTVSILADIFAAHARVEGMKAENMQREIQGDSMAYTAKDFDMEAAGLARSAEAARWQADHMGA